MTVPERIEALRALMEFENIDAVLVPTDDFHNSEYVGDYFRCRAYITGFTGSAGTALIMQDNAWLWTDGRYFLQAASQLSGSGVTLMKAGMEGVPSVTEFLKEKMKPGQTLAFDGRTVNDILGEELAEAMAECGAKVRTDIDAVGQIWDNRPAISTSKIWELEVRFAGKERWEKIADIRRKMAKAHADYLVLTSLDDIAWLLNLRGDDVECNPVFLSYLILSQSKVRLFVNPGALTEALARKLESEEIEIMNYSDFYTFLEGMPKKRSAMLDPARINYAAVHAIPEEVARICQPNPTLMPKACKNPVEAANVTAAHIRDGVAVTRFIYWLKHQVGKETISEISAAEKLERFRSEGRNYMGPSFSPIIAYKDHASIVHYSATPETDVYLEPDGMVLCDTGGQYLDGTTDITRTVVLGELTQEEKAYFTLVLKGHLNLGAARFPYGCSGRNLDVLARTPLWMLGEDYNHGTGHGVGFMLNVHEGPQSFRWKSTPGSPDTVLEEGMIISNEPGYYKDGEFGIRHENLMIVKKGPKTLYGQFMQLVPLTLVPFDLDGIIPEMLTSMERDLLNEYHRKVYNTIGPKLPPEEAAWLDEVTREI